MTPHQVQKICDAHALTNGPALLKLLGSLFAEIDESARQQALGSPEYEETAMAITQVLDLAYRALARTIEERKARLSYKGPAIVGETKNDDQDIAWVPFDCRA